MEKSVNATERDSWLLANALRQKHVKIEAIIKEFRADIKARSRELQKMSNRGYYLGEGVRSSSLIWNSINKALNDFYGE